jgi:hypothetical protein
MLAAASFAMSTSGASLAMSALPQKADMGLALPGASVGVPPPENQEHNCRRGKKGYLS